MICVTRLQSMKRHLLSTTEPHRRVDDTLQLQSVRVKAIKRTSERISAARRDETDFEPRGPIDVIIRAESLAYMCFSSGLQNRIYANADLVFVTATDSQQGGSKNEGSTNRTFTSTSRIVEHKIPMSAASIFRWKKTYSATDVY